MLEFISKYFDVKNDVTRKPFPPARRFSYPHSSLGQQETFSKPVKLVAVPTKNILLVKQKSPPRGLANFSGRAYNSAKRFFFFFLNVTFCKYKNICSNYLFVAKKLSFIFAASFFFLSIFRRVGVATIVCSRNLYLNISRFNNAGNFLRVCMRARACRYSNYILVIHSSLRYARRLNARAREFLSLKENDRP